MDGSLAGSVKSKNIQKDINLVFGCGKFPKPGWVNLDKMKLPGADIVHNLDVFPYPFRDGSVRYILAENVIEHLEDIVKVMIEVHRILRPGGKIEIITPYYKHKQSFSDPTHKHHLTEYSMDYFIEGGRYADWYTDKKFKRVYFKKYNMAFPFWHIKKYLGVEIRQPLFASTLHWVLEVIK